MPGSSRSIQSSSENNATDISDESRITKIGRQSTIEQSVAYPALQNINLEALGEKK
jgi:hypothetical protein